MTQQELIKTRRSEDWRKDLRQSIGNKVRSSEDRTPMPLLGDELRRTSLTDEVNLGFTAQMAQSEARRCLDCPTPGCVSGCPVGIHIPTFIKLIEHGDFVQAAKIIRETSSLSAICSRVCPHENQCEGNCIYPVSLKKRAVAIGPLERFATEYALTNNLAQEISPKALPSNGKKVAVVGSGPAGLAFANDMALLGYSVTVFESLGELGGIMRYGIPEFRLPRRVIDDKLNELKALGVEFVTNCFVGVDISYAELEGQGFCGFFIAGGCNKPDFMGIPGEDLPGIISSYEYLKRASLYQEGVEGVAPPPRGTNVAIIGGGNTAMDVVRTAKRLGAKHATVVYRRSETEMPACLAEIHEAKEEGAEFLTLHTAHAYYPDEHGHVAEMELQQMMLGEPDENGRRKPYPIEGALVRRPVDLVVVSIGTSTDQRMYEGVKEQIEINRWGTIEVNDQLRTSAPIRIYAGGDVINGGDTVVRAMGDGRKAAKAMHQEIMGITDQEA